MRHSLLRSLAAAAAALCIIATVRASGPAFWVIATSGELLKGTSNGVYITSEGSVMAGPRLTNRVATAPAQVWSLAVGPDDTLWAGTGGDGRVLRIRAGQTEETAFDSDENNVFAIAASGSRVFAATGPDGRVYVIENGAARPFFDPAEKYIWALAVDKSGRLWVGAGNPAVIYRVDANGAGTPIYRPPAAHVVCLAMDAGGRIFAGTESPGRLYRLDNDGAKPFVVLDSGLNELRAVSFGPEGLTFAAALAKGDDNQASELASISSALPPPTPPGGSSPPTPAPRRSVVFRIDASGSWEPFWESTDTIYDLAAKDDGGVLVASGPEGRLYRIDPDRHVFLYSGVDAKQITRILAPLDRNLSVMATANPGRVVSLGPSEQTPATYTSPVKDTKSASTWGIIRWESIGVVAMYTRSGNTDTPDDSWSDWAGPYARKDGDSIKSPAARFLQWKAVFTRPTAPPLPQLTSVTVAYLPRNTRPTISSIVTHPPGVVFQRPFAGDDGAIAGLDDVTADARKPPGDVPSSNAPVGRRMYQKGLQTIVWKADDGDGDRLSYSLMFRREGDNAWTDLRAGLNDPIFVWDTTSVADGRYIIKVVASDDPSNAGERALTSERETDPIDVDNTPPVITTEVTRQSGKAQLVVRVHDGHSAIQKVEYSRDGNRWQLIYPVDGLSDSPDERYEIPLQNEADAAKIMIRATDALQNVASQAGKS